MKRSSEYKPSAYEIFLRRMAYRLKDLKGTWKLNKSIDEEVVELIDFMIDLRAAGVRNIIAKIIFNYAMINVCDL